MILKIDQKVYPVDIIFACDESPTRVNNWFKKNYGINEYDFSLQATGEHIFLSSERENKNLSFIQIGSFKRNNVRDMQILVHEIYHSVISVGDHLGFRDEIGSSEAGAYLYDCILGTILEKLWMKKKK